MKRTLQRFLALALLAALGSASAQRLRDPTLPPVETGAAGTAGVGNGLHSEPIATTSVIVREGQPYLVVGTRLYAQGEKLGQARIERISETEVWLREAGQLRKVPRFNGIERHAAVTLTASTDCAPDKSNKRPTAKTSKVIKPSKAAGANKPSKISKKRISSKPSRAVAPCVGVQP